MLIKPAMCGVTICSLLFAGTLWGQSLSRPNQILIQKGLQQQVWADDGDGFQPTSAEWTQSNFTTMTFYGSSVAGSFPFDQTFLDANPNAQWGAAQAPYSGHLSAGTLPTSTQKQNGYLTTQQAAYLSRLASVQFGDEEGYSSSQVSTDEAWFNLSKQFYPAVLVSTNQYSGQWSQSQLKSYLQTAQPDLLTFDTYPFNGGNPAGSYPGFMDAINAYRTVAAGGYDGTGASPASFGIYLQGYRGGSNYNYIPSESEIYFNSFLPWTMGAKWTNMFRWETDPSTFLFYLPNGSHSPQFTQYNSLVAQGIKIGPYLVRLNSSSISILPGQNNTYGAVETNTAPTSIPVFQSGTGIVANLSVQNTGGANSGLPGDVVLGYFNVIPNLGSYATGYGLPSAANSLFTAPVAQVFMVLNGFAASNADPTNPNTTSGTAAECAQTITVALNSALNSQSPVIWRIDRTTGQPVQVATTLNVSGDIQFSTSLPGGTADLFFVVASANTSVAVPLSSYYDVLGITTNGTTESPTGGLDHAGYTYSSTLLGSSTSWEGLQFGFGAPNANNAVSQATISLPSGSFTTLSILATGVNGNQASQHFVVKYTDGSTTTFTQSLSDWYTPQHYSGESTVSTMSYRNTSSGGQGSGPFYLYGYNFNLNSTKTVQSLQLPANANVSVLSAVLH